MKSRLKNPKRKDNSMPQIYSKETIKKQLEAMLAPQNSVVTVHSALRKVGSVEGRGEGLLDAFIEYFTKDGGLFVVPTHTWDNLGSPGKPTLDMNIPHTCIGKLTEIAAAHPDAHRSMHPTHSVAVFGDSAKAEMFIKGDETVDLMISPDGCYGNIYRQGGYVLLVGVGHESNTYIHCIEAMLNVPDRVEKEHNCKTSVLTTDGRRIERRIRGLVEDKIGDVSVKYPKFEPAFRYHGCITDGFIGDAKAQLCDAVKMKEVLELIYTRSKGVEILADDEPLDEKYYT